MAKDKKPKEKSNAGADQAPAAGQQEADAAAADNNTAEPTPEEMDAELKNHQAQTERD